MTASFPFGVILGAGLKEEIRALCCLSKDMIFCVLPHLASLERKNPSASLVSCFSGSSIFLGMKNLLRKSHVDRR